jgi:hypothetical protein
MSENPHQPTGFTLRRRTVLMLGVAIGLGSLAWGIWKWRSPAAPEGSVLLADGDGGLLLDDDGTALMEVE